MYMPKLDSEITNILGCDMPDFGYQKSDEIFNSRGEILK